MKRFLMIAALVGVMMVLLAGTAMAQTDDTSATPQGQGYGSGSAACSGLGFAGMRGAPAWAGQPEAVSELLGLSQTEIQAERLAGKSLAEIAAAQGVSEQALIETMLTAKKAILDEQAAAGDLTQEQADLIYTNMTQRVSEMINRTTVGRPDDRGGAAGMAGRGRGAGAGNRSFQAQ